MNIKYKLIKEKRKSLKLFIKNSEVVVKSPTYISKKIIDEFVEKNRDWIEKRLIEDKKRKKYFKKGEKFLFLGKEYLLKFDERYEEMIFDNAFICKNEDVKNKMINFYKKVAKSYIKERVEFFAKKFGLKFSSIKINSAKKRWGSCSSKKSLNFTYRLIMCPENVIDYVIIHELTHLNYMNHSKDFWTLVSKRCPNYKNCERWLKENSLKTLI